MVYNSPCEILKEERPSGFKLHSYIKGNDYNKLTLVNNFNDMKIITLNNDISIIDTKVIFNNKMEAI